MPGLQQPQFFTVSETEIAKPGHANSGPSENVCGTRAHSRTGARLRARRRRNWSFRRRRLAILQAPSDAQVKRRAAAHCGGERAFVEIVEFAAHRDAMG